MESRDIVFKVADWLLSGYSRNEIREFIKDESPTELLTNVYCDEIITKSKDLLGDTVSTDTRQIITNHINLFEEIYRYMFFIQHTDGMNKALKAKERLLGMIGTSKVVINKRSNINISRTVAYDFNRLTEEERIRMKYLTDKGYDTNAPTIEMRYDPAADWREIEAQNRLLTNQIEINTLFNG